MTTNNKKTSLIEERLSLILNEVQAVPKDSENKSQGYMYRSIDAVCAALHDLFAKHNVFYVPKVVNKDRQILDKKDKQGNVTGKTVLIALDMEYKFICSEDKSSLTVGPVIGEAMDFGDKASAKAQTMALKTMLLQVFCIPVQNSFDPDSNGNGDTGTPKAQGSANDLLADKKEKEAKKKFAQVCSEMTGLMLPPDTLRILLRDTQSLACTTNINTAARWLKEKGEIVIDSEDGNVWLKEKELANAGK